MKEEGGEETEERGETREETAEKRGERRQERAERREKRNKRKKVMCFRVRGLSLVSILELIVLKLFFCRGPIPTS